MLHLKDFVKYVLVVVVVIAIVASLACPGQVEEVSWIKQRVIVWEYFAVMTDLTVAVAVVLEDVAVLEAGREKSQARNQVLLACWVEVCPAGIRSNSQAVEAAC